MREGPCRCVHLFARWPFISLEISPKLFSEMSHLILFGRRGVAVVRVGLASVRLGAVVVYAARIRFGVVPVGGVHHHVQQLLLAFLCQAGRSLTP